MFKKLFSKLIARTLLVAALALSAFAYYLKFPDFREWVDARAPIVKELTGPVVAKWDEEFPQATVMAPAPETLPAAKPTSEPAAISTPSPTPFATVVESTPQPDEESVELAKLSQSKSKWPKEVMLKKPVEFPAVVNGRISGNIKAPAGVEARLVMIKGSQVVVEYLGGGAMVDIADTDLIQQMRMTDKEFFGNSTPGMAVAETWKLE